MTDYTSPDKKRSALITIDLQRDFSLRGAIAEIPGTEEILPATQNLVSTFRKKGLPIIHVVRLYLEDGSNVDLCRKSDVQSGKKIVSQGSLGAELVEELKPKSETKLDSGLLLSGQIQTIAKNEWIMYKPRWGAFYSTPLEAHLRNLGINTLVIAGCNFPNCPRTTIYEASERDFKVVLVTDAVSGLYEQGAKELKNIAVSLMTTSEVIKWVLDFEKMAGILNTKGKLTKALRQERAKEKEREDKK